MIRGSALWMRRAPYRRDHLRAALVTALLPAAPGLGIAWLVPAGCDVRGNPEIYRWTCLLPGLLVSVPLAQAAILPFAFMLNRRWGRPLPDGWLVTICATGLLTHVVLVFGYTALPDPAYFAIFRQDVLFTPQPLVAGAIAGGVYWAALDHFTGRTHAKGVLGG